MKWLLEALVSLLPAFDWKDLVKSVVRHSPWMALAGVLLWVLVYVVLIPDRQRQDLLVDSVMKTNQKFADAATSTAVSIAQLVEIVRASDQSARRLEK